MTTVELLLLILVIVCVIGVVGVWRRGLNRSPAANVDDKDLREAVEAIKVLTDPAEIRAAQRYEMTEPRWRYETRRPEQETRST